MEKPFLLRFAKKCLSPNRALKTTKYIYDHEEDMVIKVENGVKVYAIDCQDDPPLTKKADIEKGDDLKDKRIWR